MTKQGQSIFKPALAEDIFKEEPAAVFTPIETPVVSSEIKIEGATVADNDPRLDEEVVNDMASEDEGVLPDMAVDAMLLPDSLWSVMSAHGELDAFLGLIELVGYVD